MSNFVGSRISLISKAGIRYEGTLVDINAAESTVALENVTSFGTENRPAPTTYPPSKTPYSFIKFRGSDIADLHVYEHTTPPLDPAIIEATRGPANVSAASLSPGGPVGNSTFGNSFNSSSYSQSGGLPNYTVGGPTPANSLQETSENADKSSSPAQPSIEVASNKSDRNEPDNRNNSTNESGSGSSGYNRGRGRRDNRRNSYNNRRHREGMPYTNKTLSFEDDFDFESANAKLNKTQLAEEFNKKMGKLSLSDEPVQENNTEPIEVGSNNNDDACYDKTKSFFDSISCEALEKEKGQRRRPPSWHQERSLNSETFGEGTVNYQRRNNYRSDGYRGRGPGNFYNRDNYNYHNAPRYGNYRGRPEHYSNFRGNYRNEYRPNGYRNDEGYSRRDDGYRRDYNNRDNRYSNYRSDNSYPRDRNFSNRDYHSDGFRRNNDEGRSSYRRDRNGRSHQSQHTPTEAS